MVSKGYLRESPFANIQPVGRPNRGKKQLRFDDTCARVGTGASLEQL